MFLLKSLSVKFHVLTIKAKEPFFLIALGARLLFWHEETG